MLVAVGDVPQRPGPERVQDVERRDVEAAFRAAVAGLPETLREQPLENLSDARVEDPETSSHLQPDGEADRED